MTPSGCPACSSQAQPAPVEEHFDRIGSKTYRIVRCPDCGVVSSEPREAVGADWYAACSPLRGRQARPAPESDRRFRLFFDEGLPPGRLLDVGCGDGGFLVLAARRGFTVSGFDYDERVAAQARAKGLDDVHAMEFSDFIAGRQPAEFDAATLFDVLEHTPEPAWFLKKIKGLLKPGAHIAITLPNALRPLPWGREEHDYPPHHFTRWTPEALKGFLERSGFEVVHQDCDRLELRYLSDHFFFYRLMPRLISLAKRVLFGRGGVQENTTLSELYDRGGGACPGALGDRLTRQKLVNAARLVFQIASAPFFLILMLTYRLRRTHCGNHLYTLARLRPEAGR